MATVKQIEQEIIDWHNSQESKDSVYFEEAEYLDFAWGQSDYSFYDELYSNTVKLASGEAKKVRDTGGSDEGTHRSVIFSVGEQYFEAEGYYSSWEGDNWDDINLKEVTPKEVKVIRFFPKEG